MQELIKQTGTNSLKFLHSMNVICLRFVLILHYHAWYQEEPQQPFFLPCHCRDGGTLSSVLSLSAQVLSVGGAGMFVEMMSWSPAPAVMARCGLGPGCGWAPRLSPWRRRSCQLPCVSTLPTSPDPRSDSSLHQCQAGAWTLGTRAQTEVPEVYANMSQSRRRPLLGPSPGWKWLWVLSHTFKTLSRHYANQALTHSK